MFSISKFTKSLVILSLLSILLFGVRWLKTQELLGVSLIWNLFLAWVPLFFALVARRFYHNTVVKTTCIGLWLLFFPNAPYIITDLVHLSHLPAHLWWYDSLGIFVAAFTGLLLGVYSLSIIHRLLKESLGTKWAIFTVTASVILCGFGIYLGRFLRFNSWDIVTQPQVLLKSSLLSLLEPLALQTTLVFAIALGAIYYAFYNFINHTDGLEKGI